MWTDLSNNTLASPWLAPALTGFGLMASLIVAIGAQNSFVLRQGLRREHVGLIVAVCAGLDIALTALGVAGVGQALGAQPRWLDALSLLGALALLAYGLAAARRALSPHALSAPDAAGQTRSRRQVLAQVLALTLLNPHVYLDTVVLAGAVGARQPGAGQLSFVLGAGLASSAWFTLLGVGARWLTPLFARPAAWRVLDGVIALTMFALAASLSLGAWAGWRG